MRHLRSLQRLGSSRPDRRRAPRRGTARLSPRLEGLEARELLSGVWTPVANPLPSPDGSGTMMLLSDGTAMVLGGGGSTSSAWYRLAPDASGNYSDGTWSPLASMSLPREAFGSAVLPSGKVLVVGGEYSGASNANSEINTGEIYDPVANRWTNIPKFPQADFGDDPTEVLPDGRVLGGFNSGSQTAIYNPATNTWVNGPNKLHNDSSAEESWVKLPDGSILAYSLSSDIAHGAQRYVPSLNAWVDAGTAPVELGSNGGNSGIVPELGPAFLLPDGRAFFAGASGHTALYTPPTTLTGKGSWAAGPDIPGGLGAFDAPGAMMPDGKVLLAVGAIDGNNFPPPTTLVEFDPKANTMIRVASPDTDLARVAPYSTNLLVLPSGQVLLDDTTDHLWLYTPDGAPAAPWKPAITGIASNGGNTFTLSGTKLNGTSEGSNYGDDAQSATNYPIVRLTDASGHVRFARTSHWSSTGVSSGAAPAGPTETVQFTLPAGTPPGTYLVTSIANGIASTPVVFVVPMATPVKASILAPAAIASSGATTFRVGTTGDLSLSTTGRPTTSLGNPGVHLVGAPVVEQANPGGVTTYWVTVTGADGNLYVDAGSPTMGWSWSKWGTLKKTT